MGPESVSKVLLAPKLPLSQTYIKEEQQTLIEEGTRRREGWWELPRQRLFIPAAVAAQLVT